jgi:hypothetical protein
MLPEQESLSLSALMAVANEQLATNGFRVLRDVSFSGLPVERALLAEDDYSVVAIVGFETWTQLESEWSDAQAQLVSLLGRRLARSAPKAWDGYLVLLCTSAAPDRAAVSQIERDTTRVRKIVATVDRLRTTSDVARILDVFMPLTVSDATAESSDILDSLPELLRHEVSPVETRAVIQAFSEMKPLLESLQRVDDGL